MLVGARHISSSIVTGLAQLTYCCFLGFWENVGIDPTPSFVDTVVGC